MIFQTFLERFSIDRVRGWNKNNLKMIGLLSVDFVILKLFQHVTRQQTKNLNDFIFYLHQNPEIISLVVWEM